MGRTSDFANPSAFTRWDASVLRSRSDVGPSFPRHDDIPAQTWTPLLDELLRIRNYNDDWDGEGTEAPHPALIDGAITLARHLEAIGISPADRVNAGVNGTIYFEWHTPTGYQEIEVTSPIDAEWRWVRKGSDQAEVVRINCRSSPFDMR